LKGAGKGNPEFETPTNEPKSAMAHRIYSTLLAKSEFIFMYLFFCVLCVLERLKGAGGLRYLSLVSGLTGLGE
jgi:hypothetical protein